MSSFALAAVVIHLEATNKMSVTPGQNLLKGEIASPFVRKSFIEL